MMDEVRICPLDTSGRYHPPTMRACPHCAREMESYHRRRDDLDDEGMATGPDGGPLWAIYLFGCVAIAVMALFAYLILRTL